MIVADSEVVKLHDARMLDALDDLVLLQKPPERVIEVVLILVPIANHLQRDQRPGGLALRQVQVGNRPRSDPTDTPVPANECAAEPLRLATRRARLPLLASTRLRPLRIGNGPEELLGLDLIATHNGVRTEVFGLDRINMQWR